MGPFTRNLMWAVWWAFVAAFCFLAAVVFANIVKGEPNQWEQFPLVAPTNDADGRLLQGNPLPPDEVWMPAFRKWIEEQNKTPTWEAPCVCACADQAIQDKCCAGPVAQSGERLPCKQGAAGAEPARSTKP